MGKHPFESTNTQVRAKFNLDFQPQERKALNTKLEHKRLEQNAALQEMNLQEALGKGSPSHQCLCERFEELLKRAGRLKNEGRLQEASLLCQKALCIEPENLELRQYIQRLDVRINMQFIAAKQEEKWKDVNKYSSLLDQEHNSLQLTAADRDHFLARPRGRVHQDYRVQPSPAQYAEELRRQAADVARAKKERRRIEQEEERLEVEAQKELQRRDNYRRHVGGGDDRLAWQREMAAQAEEQCQERRRKFILDQNPVGDVVGNPLLGYGQLDKMREAARGPHHVQGYAAYTGSHRRPSTPTSLAPHDGSAASASILDQDEYATYQHMRGHRQPASLVHQQQRGSPAHQRPHNHGRPSQLQSPSSYMYQSRQESAPARARTPSREALQYGAQYGGPSRHQAQQQQQQQQQQQDQKRRDQEQEHYRVSVRPGISLKPQPMRPRSANYAYDAARASPLAEAMEPERRKRYGQVKQKEGVPGQVVKPRDRGAPYGADHFIPEVRPGADLSPRAVAQRQVQFVEKHKKKPAHVRVGDKPVSHVNYKRPVDKFMLMAE